MTPTRRAISAVTTAFVLVVTGCSSASDQAGPTTAPPGTSHPTGVTTTTTSPTTTQPAGPTQGAATSNDAAAQLVAAWEARDQTAAAKIAEPIAVMGIFGTPDPAMWMRGCTTDDALDQGGCVYRTRSGLVQINTSHENIGWVVTSASFDAFDDGNSVSGNAPAGPPD